MGGKLTFRKLRETEDISFRLIPLIADIEKLHFINKKLNYCNAFSLL